MTDGTLDAIVTIFQQSSFTLFLRVYDPMRLVFVSLFIIDFSWDAGVGLLADAENLWSKLLRKLIVFAVLWGILITAPYWLSSLLDGFSYLAGDLTGTDGLSPSTTFDAGIELFSTMFLSWEQIASIANPIGFVLRLLTSLTILLAFTMIAGYLTGVLIESALALGALVFFLAFAGSKYSWGLAEGYLRYLLGLGVRIFVVSLLVSLGTSLAVTWTEILIDAPRFGVLTSPHVFLAIPLTAIIWASLVLRLPTTIAREITGPFSLSALNPMGRATTR